MSNVVLTLGDFTFQDLEVPPNITLDNGHRVVLHKLVGGARVADMLGPDLGPIAWTGLLLGEQALERALQLQEMADAGLPLQLAFSQYAYTAVITHCRIDFEAEFRLSYQIICEKVAEGAPPEAAQPDPDELVNDDMNSAQSLSDDVGDSTLSNFVANVKSAISEVSSFANAVQSQIAAVLAPINAARQQIKTLIAAGENTLMNVTTLGGILPGNPISQQVAKLSGQINTLISQPKLVQLDSTLSRMSMNLSAIGTTGTRVAVMGGNLYDQAAKLYKNAEGWAGLAKANPQLKGDPNISSPTTLTVPPLDAGSGGVLYA